MMRMRWTTIATIASVSTMLAACQSAVRAPTELSTVQRVNDAYLAYEREDCETVHRLTDPEGLETWGFNEIRHSMLLLQGFCSELEGKIEDAQTVYRRLLRDASMSFAAEDARERLRVLKIEEQDPSYARWMRDARDRADPRKATRKPIDRIPAQYPPLAKSTGIEGYAIIEFGVTPRGETEEPVIVESSPPFLFEGTSLRAVREWRFMREPGAAATSRQLIRIRFQQANSFKTPGARSSVNAAL